MLDIEKYKYEIEQLCRKYGIKRLELFGSAVSDDFNTSSDVDCLIDFVEDGGNYFNRYFDFKDDIEMLFGRQVDLVVSKAIRNPYFRHDVDQSKQLVYAA